MVDVKRSLNPLHQYILEKGGVSNLAVHSPASRGDLKKLKDHYGFDLPKDLILYYKKINGFSHLWNLNWKTETEIEESLNGRIVFFDLKTALAFAKKPSSYGVQELSDYFEQGYLIFGGDGINKFYSLIKCTEKECQLFLFLNQKELLPLHVSIEEFINFALSGGGQFQWELYTSQRNFPLLKKLTYDAFFDNLQKVKTHLPKKEFKNQLVAKFSPFLPPGKELPHYANLLTNALSKASASVEIYTNKINPGCFPQLLRRAELNVGHKLPPAFVAFFQQANGLQLHWKSKRSGAQGNFKLLSIGEIFGGALFTSKFFWENNVSSFLKLKGKPAKDLKDFYPLVIEEAGITAFKLGVNDMELFFITDFQAQRLTLGFTTYIEKLINARGTTYWQLLFLEEPYKRDNPLIQDMLKGVSECFPEQDLDVFKSED